MELLEALQFVKGAVARKDFVPALTHFHISNNMIKSFNGNLALCCPIQLDIEATPKAVPFIKAIQTCKDTVVIHITPTGKLSIKSGKFKAFIECTEEMFPDAEPGGEIIKLNGGLLPALTALKPFIAEDASRPWARGILFSGGSAFATNNICLMEHWLGYQFPAEINIPEGTIKELLRIKEEPKSLQIDQTSITFNFSDGRWLRSNLLGIDWPDVSSIINQPNELYPIPDGFFDAVDDLGPFVDDLGRIFLKPESLSTAEGEGYGADIECITGAGGGCFHNKQLAALRDVITSANFTVYPAPCPFQGESIRGVIMGMRP